MTDSDGKYEEKIPVRADGTRPRRRGQQEATTMRVLSLEFYLHFSQFDGRKWPDGLLHMDGEVLRKGMHTPKRDRSSSFAKNTSTCWLIYAAKPDNGVSDA